MFRKITDGLLPCFMMVFPSLFFAYQFVVRLAPSLLTDELMQQLSIGAGMFGTLSSAYYFGYSFAHIPMAILIERYSPKIVISVAYVLCGLLLLAFHTVTNFYAALLIRLLIGIVSSVGFVGASKVALQWFAKENYGIAFSLAFAVALLGAVFAGEPLNSLFNAHGSRNILIAIVGVSFVLSCGAFLFLRAPEKQDDDEEVVATGISLSDVKKLVCSFEVILLGSVSLTMVGLYDGFADLWGVTYTAINFALSKGDAAFVVSWIFFGLIVGGPILTFLGRAFGNALIVALTGILTAIIFYTVVLSSMNLSLYVLAACMFILGILASYQVLVLSMCTAIVSHRLATVAVSLLNCMNMFGGLVFHSAIGIALDSLWDGAMRDGYRYYSAETFHSALLAIPIGSLLGTIIVITVDRMLRKNNTFHH